MNADKTVKLADYVFNYIKKLGVKDVFYALRRRLHALVRFARQERH